MQNKIKKKKKKTVCILSHIRILLQFLSNLICLKAFFCKQKQKAQNEKQIILK